MPDEKQLGSQPEEPDNRLLAWIKNIFVFLVLVAVVTASFWLSFQLGRRILLPVKNLPEEKIEVSIPETPESIKNLQEIEKLAALATGEGEELKPIEPAPVKKNKPVKKKSTVKRHLSRTISRIKHYYKVQAALFSDRIKAKEMADKIISNGFDIYLKKVGDDWRVQVGAFGTRQEAEAVREALQSKGFASEIIYE